MNKKLQRYQDLILVFSAILMMVVVGFVFSWMVKSLFVYFDASLKVEVAPSEEVDFKLSEARDMLRERGFVQ